MTLWLVAVLMMTTQGSPAAAVTTVDRVDLDRYLGTWCEVARLPNRFQRSCAGDVRATYARRPDGRIDVVNRCRTTDGDTTEAQGVARIVDEQTSAKLKVRFAPAFLSVLPFVWGDYWILGLADDYSWAVVGSPDRKYLWILSRTLALEADDFEAAVGVARSNGFDVGALTKTSHSLAPPARPPRRIDASQGLPAVRAVGRCERASAEAAQPACQDRRGGPWTSYSRNSVPVAVYSR